MNAWNEPPATALGAVMEFCNHVFDVNDEDKLCRVTVECLRREIGLDRACIFLADHPNHLITGTYGIDPTGQLQNLHDQRLGWEEAQAKPDHPARLFLTLKRETEASARSSYRHLVNPEGRTQGYEELVCLLWDGSQACGVLHCDNLIRHRGIMPSQVECTLLIACLFSQLLRSTRAEQSMVSQRNLLINIADSLPDALVVFDSQLRYMFANRVKFELSPYKSLEEIIGKQPKDFYASVLKPGDFDPHLQVLKTGQPLFGTKTHEHHGPIGTRHFIESILPLRNSEGTATGIIVHLRDVTHLRQSERSLADSEALFRSIWENSIDAMRLTDVEGRILAVNPAFCRLFQTSEAQCVGQKICDLFHPQEYDSLTNYLARFEQNDQIGPVRVQRRLPNGQPVTLEATYSRFTLSDGSVRLLSIIRDATAAVQQESQRLALEKRMLESQRMESLGLMAGSVAHDFNNMPTGILGNASLALMNLPTDSQARADIQRIEQICFKAADLCQQLLAYSGRGRFEVHTVDLNSLLRDMQHLLEVSIHRKIQLVLELQKDLPAVEVDMTQIRQLILNLVINASEAIGDQEGTIRLHTSVCTLTQSDLSACQAAEDALPGSFVTLEVKDNGPGISPNDLSHIFEPFFTTKFTGRGLGLSAALGIARGHKGALKVESTPGQGASFRFFFPVSSIPLATAEPDHPETIEATAPSRILVVDDEPSIRNLAERILTHHHHEVVTAADGQEALDCFRASDRKFDLVLLDLTMPRMNGHDTLHYLRAVDSKIPVLIMSGYSEAELEHQFKIIHPTGFIQKPFNATFLLSEINRHLNRHAQSREKK